MFSTVDEALDWLSDVFEEPPGRITPNMVKKEDILGWDSLGTLTLMARLDAELGILLSDDELQKLLIVNDILNVMRHHGKLNQHGGK